MNYDVLSQVSDILSARDKIYQDGDRTIKGRKRMIKKEIQLDCLVEEENPKENASSLTSHHKA